MYRVSRPSSTYLVSRIVKFKYILSFFYIIDVLIDVVLTYIEKFKYIKLLFRFYLGFKVYSFYSILALLLL